MTAILYPVAANAEQALARPLARATREREARTAAREAVVFTTDPTGPAFATREAALAAYAGRVEDERTGFTPGIEDRFCKLVEQLVIEPGRTAPLAPVTPTFEDGRRWPEPPTQAPRTAWRLMVSYWRVASAERPIEAPQARQARRARQSLDPETLRAIARQPLRPVEPQQPLDIGLFEVRLPERPDIVVPDE
ncbi:hypothetical protein [Phenylobacterium deserti]|uniref:Uncharacterized protein n=1 Tax=Phenylobacterium deserti TaxID=1914756 RepID=A0A328AS32_9CAUL|nr:hypothetical protein [Phenylobacterium deserti]RAK57125.1 hypothetical protein DJ018_03990 [Phenylobacterium deserti]